MSKNLYIKNYLLPTNIIVSLDPCPLSPIFWCFRAGFCDLLFSKPRELPTGTFFFSAKQWQKPVPCRDMWSKRTDKIQYIQYICPLGSETTLGLHLSTSLDLRFQSLFSQPMCHQQSQKGRLTGILFRMVSRQTATIATSCSIWPHEILAFTTSTFPSFYSSYILAHFQVFTVQSHATQLTTLCADERGYMSNTSSLLFSLPVIFVLDRWGGGGGGTDVFVWAFLKGHALIHSR